jgi:hypothetical protein
MAERWEGVMAVIAWLPRKGINFGIALKELEGGEGGQQNSIEDDCYLLEHKDTNPYPNYTYVVKSGKCVVVSKTIKRPTTVRVTRLFVLLKLLNQAKSCELRDFISSYCTVRYENILIGTVLYI